MPPEPAAPWARRNISEEEALQVRLEPVGAVATLAREDSIIAGKVLVTSPVRVVRPVHLVRDSQTKSETSSNRPTR